MPFWIIISFIVIALALMLNTHNARLANIAEWRALAEARGLRFERGGHSKLGRLTGPWRGVEVHVASSLDDGDLRSDEERFHDPRLPSGGKQPPMSTLLLVHVPVVLPAGFKLFPQNLLAELCKLVGEEDHEIDDDTFDRKLIIQGAELEEVRAFLADAQTRAVFLSLFEKVPDARFDGQRLRVKRGGVLSGEEVAHVLDTLTDHLNNLPDHLARHHMPAEELTLPPEPPQPAASW